MSVNSKQEPQWRVKNVQQAVIILPFPPLSSPDMEILPIGGTAIVNSELLLALDDLVDVINDDDIVGEYQKSADQTERVHAATEEEARSESETSTRVSWVDCLLPTWDRTFGSSYVKTSDLLPLADEAGWIANQGHQHKHQRVSELGKCLRRLAGLDTRPWHIKTRFRSNRSEYSLSVQSPQFPLN